MPGQEGTILGSCTWVALSSSFRTGPTQASRTFLPRGPSSLPAPFCSIASRPETLFRGKARPVVCKSVSYFGYLGQAHYPEPPHRSFPFLFFFFSLSLLHLPFAKKKKSNFARLPSLKSISASSHHSLSPCSHCFAPCLHSTHATTAESVNKSRRAAHIPGPSIAGRQHAAATPSRSAHLKVYLSPSRLLLLLADPIGRQTSVLRFVPKQSPSCCPHIYSRSSHLLASPSVEKFTPHPLRPGRSAVSSPHTLKL